MNYSIEKITTLIGARRIGTADAQIRWLLTDSRSLCFPEETLFFALKTPRNDGHRYIEDLYRRGVRNFVVSLSPNPSPIGEGSEGVKASPNGGRWEGANFLIVPSPLAALQRLAERHRDEFDIPVVGITGSNGKTMVKEWLYQVLSGLTLNAQPSTLNSQPSTLNTQHSTLNVTRSPKSYNSQIGVPLSVWLLNEQTDVALIEAGISQPGEMQALADIIQPTIGVLTSLGAPHQENFRSLEEKCMEKLQLFHDAKVIIYNADDDLVSRCIRRSSFKGQRIGWHKELTKDGIEISFNAHPSTLISPPSTLHPQHYRLPFIDEASVECSLAVAATALYLGVTPEQLQDRMARLEPVAMRLEVKEGQRGCTLINDSYNSDINSLDIALDFMQRRPDHQGRCRTLILSDIQQSGITTPMLYQEVNDLCVKRGIDKFIGIGPDISAQHSTLNIPHSTFFPTTEAFLASDTFRSLHDEVILIKGARQFGFDRITELLEQKVHETILEVNLNAVVNNLNYYRSFLKPETKIVCMVKADAYGAGAVEVAKTLQDHRVDYLAVAVADEGVELRRNGITQNIMIMNPEMTTFKTMFDYELEPEVYSFRLMDALIRAAEKEGITDWPVHIKLDTGMHRLGFDPEKDMDELISRLKHQNAIIPRSVFSHFVGSDSDDFDNFSRMQFERFLKGSEQLQAAFSHHILRHMDNSAGIEHFPERQLDMCRLGLGLYGIDPYSKIENGELGMENYDNQTSADSADEKKLSSAGLDNTSNHNSEFSILNSQLQCVSTLKTTILQLRHVPKEETVGYSRKGILTRDSLIAAIPIGYADGLNRHLGRGACYCLVNGQKAPYVGNICMDVAMIDVTDVPDVHEGDMVEIFGANLPVTVLSNVLDTIPYEVLTAVSGRVKKVYFQD